MITARATTPPTLEQMLSILRALDTKVEDLRSMMTSNHKSHLVVEEFARLVGRSPFTVRRWITNGQVHAIRLADSGPKGRLLIPRAELERLVNAGLGGNVPACAIP